jgi:prepilin-type N-terminal cleavage/methylation domain-containing protein/prepilin-type processing-associated H-X9-DG protein
VSSRKGFTLIELLVVIAILAAMLFPVFARARESARKIQCLSNVKNIATAVQMYLVDYDRFPPKEHDAEVRQAIMDYCGASCDSAADCRGTTFNPYLRWAVILDEYVKNRDVWRCPSARSSPSLSINWGYGTGQWWQFAKDTWLQGACHIHPCAASFPPGWGGSITDSVTQDQCGGPDTGGFDQSIGTVWTLTDMKTGQMTDPAKYVVCADAGTACIQQLDRTSWIAYPDTCRIDSVACNPNCGADWANCSWSVDCGALKGDWRWATDPQYRKDHAKARHLGGENLGFADGHAAWMSSEAILFGGENWSGYASNPDNPLLLGVGVCINPTRAY